MIPGARKNEDYCDDYMREGTSKDSSRKQNNARLSLDSGIGNDSFNDSQFRDASADHYSSFESFSSSFLGHSSTVADLSESPPTKWARIRTPPNKKSDETTNDKNKTTSSLFSPPSIRTATAFSSSHMLKTPTSFRGPIRMTTTPSSFHKTRVKFSKTPLKLSNTDNVSGYHIGLPGDLKRVNSVLTVRRIGVTSGASKRCLVPNNNDSTDDSQLDDCLEYESAPNRPDFEGFNILNGDTPTKINAALEGDTSFSDIAVDSESEVDLNLDEPSTSKRHVKCEDDRSILNLLHPRGVREACIEGEMNAEVDQHNDESVGDILEEPLEKIPIDEPAPIIKKKEHPKRVEPNSESSPEEKKKAILEKDILKWKNLPFVSPKKELDVFSGRWIVISTGRTLAQQELLSDARSFFKKKKPLSSSSGDKKEGARRVSAVAKINLFKKRFVKK